MNEINFKCVPSAIRSKHWKLELFGEQNPIDNENPAVASVIMNINTKVQDIRELVAYLGRRSRRSNFIPGRQSPARS